MKTIQYQSHLFDQVPDSTGKLAIYCSAEECIFAMASSSNVLVYYHQFLNNTQASGIDFIQQTFAENQQILSKDFQNITIGLQSNAFTLLPDAVAIEHQEAMNILLGEQDISLAKTALSKIKSTLSYRYQPALEHLFNQNLQHFTVQHCIKFGIDHLTASDWDGLVIVEQNHCSLFIQTNGELQLANRFMQDSPEDILYFTLLALKDASLSPKSAKIALVNVKSGDKTVDMLRSYIQDVSLASPNLQLITHPDFPLQESNFYALKLLDENH